MEWKRWSLVPLAAISIFLIAIVAGQLVRELPSTLSPVTSVAFPETHVTVAESSALSQDASAENETVGIVLGETVAPSGDQPSIEQVVPKDAGEKPIVSQSDESKKEENVPENTQRESDPPAVSEKPVDTPPYEVATTTEPIPPAPPESSKPDEASAPSPVESTAPDSSSTQNANPNITEVVEAVAAVTDSSKLSFGHLLAAISLFFGMIFFGYSVKYYVTLAIVLAFSRNVENGNGSLNGNGNGSLNGNGNGNGKTGLFRRIFSNGNGNGYRNGNGKGGNGYANGNGNGYRNGNGDGRNGNGKNGNGKNGNGVGYRFGYLSRLSTNGHNGNGKNGNGNGHNGNGKNGNGYHNGNGSSRAEKFFRMFMGEEGGNGNGKNGNGKNGNGYRNGNGNGNGKYGNGYAYGNGKWKNGYGNGLFGKKGNDNGKSWLTRLFFGQRNGNGHNGNGKNGNGNGNGGPAGMLQDLAHVDVRRQPFISVHLPFYNERKVANRILTACTSFDYKNYEVIVVDDSTDDTREILAKWARHPKVKVIHRESRAGFKGGALRVALEHTDPRAQFVTIFDADFVPYPDTLLQFLRYFQASGTPGEAGSGAAGNGEMAKSDIAAVQGYQWHVLNKNENWITRSVRSEFAGSYVIERSGNEIIGALKQIAGSVYMIRRDLLNTFGWGTSITEDFELTIRLYAEGYRVIYTPYIQGPSECVASLKRLIRQRMRWAEGHTRIIRQYFFRILFSKHLKKREKLEFLYLAPYYLQAAFFLVGSLAWFISDAVLHTTLPFWTALWGWSLVFTNLFALPLVNAVGLFLEESPRRDYLGIFSFLALSYTLVPFQAFAALKGLFVRDESPWFRTPKTGHITDAFFRSHFRRWLNILAPRRAPIRSEMAGNAYLKLTSANNRFNAFHIIPRRRRWLGDATLAAMVLFTILITAFGPFIPQREAGAESTGGFRSLRDATPSVTVPTPPAQEIREPIAHRYEGLNGTALEYIFHPEPRVRVKLGEKEIEMTPASSPGLGGVKERKGQKDGVIYRYEEVFSGVDLNLSLRAGLLQEDYVLKRPIDFESLDERVKLTGLVMAVVNGAIELAPDTGGLPIFSFVAPFMYEADHPEVRSEGLRYKIEKETIGYRVRKVLTDEGRRWLADSNRQYPIVIDPTLVQSSPVTASFTAADAEYGSYQRHIAYSPTSSAWYAFSTDNATTQFYKCLASSNCDEDTDWGSGVRVSLDTAGQSSPSVWYQAAGTNAGKIFVSYIDDSNANSPQDSLAFNTVDTANSDAVGTQCNSVDQGTITAGNRNTYIAVGNNGDVLVGYSNHTAADVEMDIFEVPTGTCTLTSVETGSGLPTASQNVAVIPFEVATNRIQIIYNDAGGNNDLRQSQFNISNSTWNYADNDVDGAANINLLQFSAVSDGTDVWVLAQTANPGSNTDFFRCSGCNGDTAGTWTTTDAVPWSSQSNIIGVSLTYISTTPSNTLVAMILKDTTNLQAYFKTTDADTISWSAEYNFGFTAGDNGQLSSVYTVTSDTLVGMVIREGTAFSFSTLPERSLYLFLLFPALPLVFRKLRRSIFKGGQPYA